MSRGPCRSCGALDQCVPSCPELRWPDGRLRGFYHGPPLPMPPLDPTRVIPPRYWSPLSEELGGILAGIGEQAIADHVANRREGGS